MSAVTVVAVRTFIFSLCIEHQNTASNMPLNMPTSWDEVFDGEAERPKTFLHDLYAPIMAAALGFGAIAAANWATRRPPLSGSYMCDVTFSI